MKIRTTFAIISLLIVLIALIATISLQAQTNNSITVDNFAWEGVDSDSGKWELSWDTVAGTDWVWLRFKDCGFNNTWTKINNLEYSRVNDKTHVQFPPLSNNVAGETCRFKVLVRVCTNTDKSGSTTSCAYSSWSETSVTFPN